MKRGGWIVLLGMMLLLGGGFLALIWVGMRRAVERPVSAPVQSRQQ